MVKERHFNRFREQFILLLDARHLYGCSLFLIDATLVLYLALARVIKGLSVHRPRFYVKTQGLRRLNERLKLQKALVLAKKSLHTAFSIFKAHRLYPRASMGLRP